MKLHLLLLFFISLQIHAQRNLFRYNDNIYADFEFTDKEIFEFRSQGKLSIFNKEKHHSNLANSLFELKEGQSLILNNARKKELKVLKNVKVEHFRINYIFLDGKKMTYDELDELRDKILVLSKSQNFEKLAKMYSMDFNKHRSGDSGWFKSRSVPEDFKNKALSSSRAANETFKVDLKSQDWYYIVLTSYSPQLIEEILVLETEE